MRLKPIGFVKCDIDDEEIREKRWGLISNIVLEERYRDGLKGLNEFSHVYVLYWAHKARRRRLSMLLHPAGRGDMPKIGLFASRTPNRVNPICLSLVELVEIEGNVLKVRGLDAYNGSPVLDIKPYDSFDRPSNYRVAGWWDRLHGRKRSSQGLHIDAIGNSGYSSSAKKIV